MPKTSLLLVASTTSTHERRQDGDEGERWSPILFLSLWNRWMWRLETAAAAMVELFGGVLGLNLLCLAEVDWGSQKTWRQQQEEIKPRYIKFVGQRPERAFWGHFGYPEWVCLGRKGGKDWYFIWGGSEILDYIRYEGRRGVNVYQRIRKEFPLSLSAPTICLLQSLQGRCSMVVHGSNNNKRSSLSSQCDLFGCPYFLFGSK